MVTILNTNTSKDLTCLRKAYEKVYSYTMTDDQIVEHLIYAGVKLINIDIFHEFIEQKGDIPNIIDSLSSDKDDEGLDSLIDAEWDSSDSVYTTSEDLLEGLLENLDENLTIDPTEGDVWDLKYFFKKGSEILRAYPGHYTAFYCNYRGKATGLSTMIQEGWILMNEHGVELDKKQTMKIRDRIRKRK